MISQLMTACSQTVLIALCRRENVGAVASLRCAGPRILLATIVGSVRHVHAKGARILERTGSRTALSSSLFSVFSVHFPVESISIVQMADVSGEVIQYSRLVYTENGVAI